MAFGKKKNGNAEAPDTQAAVETTAETSSAPAFNNAKYNLTKVFKESVWETIQMELKENSAFVTTGDEGEPKYAVLFIDTNDIGGLDKKRAKGNQDKGQLIQQINSGQIKTYMTKDMMLDNVFIIIPDEESIDTLDEYQFMTEAPYLLAYIADDGTIEVTDDNITIDSVKSILLGKATLASVMGKAEPPKPQSFSGASDDDDDDEDDVIEEDDEDDVIEEDDDEDAAPAVKSPQSPVIDLGGDDEESDEDELFLSEDDEDPFGDEGFDEDDISEDDGPVFDDEDGTEDEFADEEYAEDTEEGTIEFISRKYYSEDLPLEISEEPFDIQFVADNYVVPFKEERGDGWLQTYVGEMSKDANAVLQNMHVRNIHKMKERYLRLMNIVCENIQREMDIHDESTYYGGLLKDMLDAHNIEIDALDRDVALRKEELEQLWKKQIEEEAERGAEMARHDFITKNRAQHEREIKDLEANMKDDCEIDYREQVNRVMEERRAEAKNRLDMGITSVLKEVSELYQTILDEENAEYQKHYDKINTFIDSNRKDEIARSRALEEQNRQKKEADKVREEYSARLTSASAEYDAKQKAYLADIEKLRAEQEARFEEMHSSYQDKLAEANKRTDLLQKQYDELLDRYSNLDKQKDIEYASRINEMNQINESLQDRFNHVEAVHNRSNKIALYLLIAVVLLGATIGFIIGAFVNIRKTNELEKQKIELQQQIEQKDDSNDDSSAVEDAIIIGDSIFTFDFDD